MRYRRLVRLALFVLAGYLIGCVLAAVLLTEGALRPGRRPVTHRAQAAAVPAKEFGAALHDAETTAADGVTLRGWFARPANSRGSAVVLVHGVSDNRQGMGGYARLFLRHGYSVLLPDARAHGESGGELATYGVLEAGDIAAWSSWLRREHQASSVFGFGESMGAALILQALRQDQVLTAVAAESPFASFREIAYDRLGQRFGAGEGLGRTLFRPIVEVGMLYARWRFGIDLEQASSENAVAGTRIPVLLIHGAEDDNIPPRHSERIASRNARVTLWRVTGARHGGAADAAPEEFETRVVAWFQAAAGAPRTEGPKSLTRLPSPNHPLPESAGRE
ncbi:MAG: alpha/beta fold hydrolase [Acidobacteria bacterium]|nr:alpha/beta fold hydrolase [Acidobacteriota bacterium]